MITQILMLPLVAGILVIARKNRRYFDLKCFDFRRWERPGGRKLLKTAVISLAGLGACLLVCLPLNAWLWRIGPVVGEDYPQAQFSRISPVLLFLFITLTVPLEEWIARRGLLEFFKSRKGPVVGVLASAAIFGLVHALDPGATPLTAVSPAVAGIVLGVVYLRGGFLASNLTHWGFNLTAFALWWL